MMSKISEEWAKKIEALGDEIVSAKTSTYVDRFAASILFSLLSVNALGEVEDLATVVSVFAVDALVRARDRVDDKK